MSVNTLLNKFKSGLNLIRAGREWVLLRKNGRLEVALCGSLILHLAVLAVTSPMAGGNSAGARQVDSRILNATLSPARDSYPLISAVEDIKVESVIPNLATRLSVDADIPSDELRHAARATPFPVAPRTADLPSLPQPSVTREVPGTRGGVGAGKQPRLLSEVVLDYPPSAGDREGRVTLRIAVSAAGIVDEIVVINSDPAGVFDEAAIKAFFPARFAPGEILGVPVKSSVVVQVEFLPTSRENVTGRGY